MKLPRVDENSKHSYNKQNPCFRFRNGGIRTDTRAAAGSLAEVGSSHVEFASVDWVIAVAVGGQTRAS